MGRDRIFILVLTVRRKRLSDVNLLPSRSKNPKAGNVEVRIQVLCLRVPI